MLSQTLLPLITLPLLASAHFKLIYPPARGFDEEILGTGPCGGQPQSDNPNRTVVSLTSIPIALVMGHDQTVIQMLLGLGNSPDDSFNITLDHTFAEQGEGDFCLPSVSIPAGAGITDGMNATLQVVTDGDTGGGLYNCADITFTTATAAALPSSCTNGTGVTASILPANEASLNANDSSATGGADGGTSSGASSSASSTVSAATASPSSAAAALAMTAWGVLGAGVFGAVALM